MSRLGVGATATGAVAVGVIAAGDGTASDALDAMVITVAVVIVLAVVGLLALLVMRVRREFPASGPQSAIQPGKTVVRAEVLGYPERPATALPATRRALPRGSAD